MDALIPQRTALAGRYTTLVALDAARHAEPLWLATRGAENDPLWLYMSDGPFPDFDEFRRNIEAKANSKDTFFFAILNPGGGAIGYASLMRIEPKHRVIEVGNILYSPPVQKTCAATEAMYLLARHVFEDLNYRRYEWKCNALNEPSRRAALRYGFQYEGVFRQHMIIKERNRDTAWFSMLDSEWPARKAAFERWLDPANFDSTGRQKASLRNPEVHEERRLG